MGGLAGSWILRRCRQLESKLQAKGGAIQDCNATYGFNGWLGIAEIHDEGGVHITQATTKMNDSYFNSATYNTTAWKNLVMCQEVGHGFGVWRTRMRTSTTPT